MVFLENCLKLQNVAVVSKVGNKESEKAAIDVAKKLWFLHFEQYCFVDDCSSILNNNLFSQKVLNEEQYGLAFERV